MLDLQAAKSQAALAAAKARFEQQQKENDEIAERNKRQRLGLPEPKPAVPEVQCSQYRSCLLSETTFSCFNKSIVTGAAVIITTHSA